MKLIRKLKGRDVQMTHGLADSIQQLEKESPEFKQGVIKFLDDLVSHYVLDDAKLVVAHAGMKEEMRSEIIVHAGLAGAFGSAWQVPVYFRHLPEFLHSGGGRLILTEMGL